MEANPKLEDPIVYKWQMDLHLNLFNRSTDQYLSVGVRHKPCSGPDHALKLLNQWYETTKVRIENLP